MRIKKIIVEFGLACVVFLNTGVLANEPYMSLTQAVKRLAKEDPSESNRWFYTGWLRSPLKNCSMTWDAYFNAIQKNDPNYRLANFFRKSCMLSMPADQEVLLLEQLLNKKLCETKSVHTCGQEIESILDRYGLLLFVRKSSPEALEFAAQVKTFTKHIKFKVLAVNDKSGSLTNISEEQIQDALLKKWGGAPFPDFMLVAVPLHKTLSVRETPVAIAARSVSWEKLIDKICAKTLNEVDFR